MYPTNYCSSRLITICGATATGKSSLALALAKRLETIILSADSRQVYRHFDIGTAKPSMMERQEVPHYLIDICEPTETLTVADYQQQAQKLIIFPPAPRQSPQWGKPPHGAGSPAPPASLALLVGGTGLYIRSIVRGMIIPRVAPNYELRSQLQQLGQNQLYAMLQQVDPIAAGKIHANDSVRSLRALEVYYVTGKPISEQQGENPPTYPILQIGLDCPNSDDLKHRIEQRTAQMLEAGLVAEVESLCQKYGVELPLLNTLGYQEIKQYLAGDISLLQAKELIVLHTRQFAKRQRTWFRACPEIEWFDANSPNLLEQVWQRVQKFLQHSVGKLTVED